MHYGYGGEQGNKKSTSGVVGANQAGPRALVWTDWPQGPAKGLEQQAVIALVPSQAIVRLDVLPLPGKKTEGSFQCLVEKPRINR
jgi:hypothetical protein